MSCIEDSQNWHFHSSLHKGSLHHSIPKLGNKLYSLMCGKRNLNFVVLESLESSPCCHSTGVIQRLMWSVSKDLPRPPSLKPSSNFDLPIAWFTEFLPEGQNSVLQSPWNLRLATCSFVIGSVFVEHQGFPYLNSPFPNLAVLFVQL